MTSTYTNKHCVDCGRALPPQIGGRPAVRCQECKANQRKRVRPDIACVDCGTVFTPNQIGAVPKRCTACAAQHKSKMNTVRGAAWARANPERATEHSRKSAARYRERNPDWVKAKNDFFNAKYARDPEFQAKRRVKDREKKYGMTVADYEAMLVAQGGLCAICRRDHVGPGKALHVDHCHSSSKVRGLLCGPCNTALGLLGDDIARVEQALAYLRRNGET